MNDNWDRWLVYFETAANIYSNPELKVGSFSYWKQIY